MALLQEPTPTKAKEITQELQTPKPMSQAEKHHIEIFKTPKPHALTSEQQDAAIRQSFFDEETIPQDKHRRQAIGKNAKLMDPQKLAMQHEAGELLKDYADHGCPVDCGADWSIEHIEALLRRGPHKSATSQEAIDAFKNEIGDKIKNGYSRVIKYGDIRHKLPKKFKLSPVAMIPHKSRSFRTILDLSFRLCLSGTQMQSVNSDTKRMAPAESMVQLGYCLQRIVAMLADNYDKANPFVFSKLDIKDGFWRMAVSESDAWNFCYVMPTATPPKHLDDIQIVVPNCLQMGWCESCDKVQSPIHV